MSNGPNATYAFLPWSRLGIAAQIDDEDPLGDGLAANLVLPVHIDVNNRPVDVDVRLFGPGNVVGFDPRQVIRTEPRDHAKDFLPNYFPAVEFARADLPWAFTPASATGRDRLRPWICLIVVEDRDGVELEFNRQMTLPVLTVGDPDRELPPLEDAWAWAHVQVAGDLDGTSLEAVASAEPHRVSSRLICPRRLQPNRDYLACVVPAFDAGVKAGLGLPDANDAPTLAAAWKTGEIPDPMKLPVYYHWLFSTGDAGDFEALARLLEPRLVPETVGTRPMDISRPGFGMPALAAGADGSILGLEGALRATTAGRTPWPAGARHDFETRLRPILDAPHIAGPEDEPGPLIAPPSYGRWHAAQTTIPDDQPRWFRQLNLDPRERTAAGFGTRVVQDQQESLMHAAWLQVEDIIEANRLLMRAQLARSVGLSIVANHLEPLSADSLMLMTSPMHTRVRMSPTTLRKEIDDSVIPTAAVTPAFRRISRPRGPVVRRIGRTLEPRIDGILHRLNTGDVVAAGPRQRPDGTVTPSEPANALLPDWLPAKFRPLLIHAEPLLSGLLATSASALLAGTALARAGRLASPARNAFLGAAGLAATSAAVGLQWARANRQRWRAASTVLTSHFSAAEIAAVEARPDFRILAADASPPGSSAAPADGPDSREGRLFREAAAEFQASLAAGEALAEPVAAPELPLESVRATMMQRIDPTVTVKDLLDQRIVVDPAVWDPGPTTGDDLEPIMAYPEFDRPMYEGLRDLSQDLLVPGLEAIKPNTVTLLETNPRFIEAYMVGLNHEMGRELLWREFPSDHLGSHFRQFWDVRGRVPPPTTPEQVDAARDVPEIHRWRGDEDLGENMTGGSAEGSLVLLVRGELLRRFPNAMIYAAKAEFETVNGVVTRSRIVTDEERHPLFRGTLDPDITFIGFDLDDDEARGHPEPDEGRPGWFLVIQQQPTQPRFGLDVAVEFADTLDALTTWSDLTWGHLAQDEAEFAELTHVQLGRPLPDTSDITDPDDVAWGENAAHMAFVTLQQPVRVAIHADDMLPVPGENGDT